MAEQIGYGTQVIDLMGVSEKVLRSDRVVAVQPRKRFMRSSLRR